MVMNIALMWVGVVMIAAAAFALGREAGRAAERRSVRACRDRVDARKWRAARRQDRLLVDAWHEREARS